MESVEPLVRAGLTLQVETARHFEENWLLDTDDSFLGAREAILRVRGTGERGAITYKEKAPAGAPASQFKQRIEIETSIGDPAAAVMIFERLGFHGWFRYQKYRTVYRAELPSRASLRAMFDETPLGNFVELEGEEEAIAEAVKLIEVTPGDYILDSYLALQAQHCEKLGKPLEDMMF